MKVYVFMADGFEVLETFAPVDVLKRCGADVMTVSIKNNLFVESSQKNLFKADKNIDEIDYKNADLIVIPGGYPGYINLRENKKVVDIVRYFVDNNKYVASICGGPSIFSTNKIACGRELTAHSSTKEQIETTHKYVEAPVHVDGKIITAVGAGHAINFAFKIAEQLFDEEVIKNVKKGMEL
ncbi:DJ-1 family glyoxalase III [Fusobacterium russii]|uniref:DJ-1 family glyoxalase III n=1 Tax=Fusobacterium russii TaxID=854 RepID=UPI0003A8E50B|nr:DJ-1 family glyoxalase III [Fusobacterium russii]